MSYRYFPEDTTYAVQFMVMVTINVYNSVEIVLTVFKKISILCLVLNIVGTSLQKIVKINTRRLQYFLGNDVASVPVTLSLI
jgi:hypothetical protein